MPTLYMWEAAFCSPAEMAMEQFGQRDQVEEFIRTHSADRVIVDRLEIDVMSGGPAGLVMGPIKGRVRVYEHAGQSHRGSSDISAASQD